MEKTRFSLKNFEENCKIILPKYFSSLDKNIEPIQEIYAEKKVILLFLKEYFKHNNTKFNRNQFNINFLNRFISELIPSDYPELLTMPRFKIQSSIKNFINYLSLQNVLNRSIMDEVIQKLINLDKKNKVLNKNAINKEIFEISNKIIKYSLNLDELYKNEDEYNRIFNYFEKKSKKLILKSIFELFKTAEDSNFLRILIFIDEFLKIETFPSKFFHALETYSKQDRYFFRLLMLYNTFFLAGYILKKSFIQLIEDLKVDVSAFYRYVTSVVDYSDIQYPPDFINFYRSQTEMEGMLDIDNYINKIVPINKESPFTNTDNYKIFNLPKNINLELQHHVNFLKGVSDSFHKKIKFINSSWDNDEDCFSNVQEKKTFKEAKGLYYDGKFSKALILVNKLIKTNPESAVALYLKGKILGEQGAHYNALKSHLKSLKFDPYRIETYMDVSFLLEIGGYFHSSILLTSLLLRFCPFDFNLHIQLSISSYQLSLSFKESLQLAGLIDAGRLINFLTRYWVNERIKSKDSLKKIEINSELFNELFKSSQVIVSNAIKVLKLSGYKINDENFLNYLNDLIRNSLHFFPNKEEHIMKNWFVYELTTRLVENFHAIFYENYYNLPYLVASKEFLDLVFEIAKCTLDQILDTQNKRKNQTIFEIDTEIILENEELFKNPIYELARFFISVEGISNILMGIALNLISECNICPNHCLENPFKWCEMFYILGEVSEEHSNYSILIRFIESLNTDFVFSLEDKGLRVETINKKVEHIETFLSFLINIVKEKDYNFISEKFENYMNIENSVKFLEYYAVKNKITSDQKAFKEMCRSLKSFVRFLYDDYDYFDKKTCNDLNNVFNPALSQKKNLNVK